MAGRRTSRDTVGEPAPAPVGGLYAIDFSADQWEALGFSRGTSRRSNLPGSRRWTERPIEYDQRALFDLAHRIETPAPPPRRQRKARKSSKWTESLNSIKLNQSWGQQGVAFRLPDNPAKLTSAACLEQLPQPSPRKSPRARAAQRVSMEGDTRSWHPQPTRWDAAAGMFVLAGTSSEDNDDNTARPPPAPVDEPDAAPSSSAIRPLSPPVGSLAPLPRLYVVEGAMVASSLTASPRRSNGAKAAIRSTATIAAAAAPSAAIAAAFSAPVSPRRSKVSPTRGSAHRHQPSASPRRNRVLASLSVSNEDEPAPLPPLPAPGDPLGELDEQVLRYALSNPTHAQALANATRHTGLSRLGRRRVVPDWES